MPLGPPKRWPDEPPTGFASPLSKRPQYPLDHLGKTRVESTGSRGPSYPPWWCAGSSIHGFSEAANVESNEDCPSLNHRPVGSDMPVT
jgi:hypothetical protein